MNANKLITTVAQQPLNRQVRVILGTYGINALVYVNGNGDIVFNCDHPTCEPVVCGSLWAYLEKNITNESKKKVLIQRDYKLYQALAIKVGRFEYEPQCCPKVVKIFVDETERFHYNVNDKN